MSSFEEQIKRWVSLDDKQRQLVEQTKIIRDEKNATCEKILSYVDTNGLGNATVRISDGKLKFASASQPAPLSLKFVQDCLTQCLPNQALVQQIMNYIREKRQVKTRPEIRRSYVDTA